jgi:hypothetical protein
MALINVSSTSELKTCVPLAALPLTPNRCYHQNAMRKLKLYALMLASAVFALLAVVWGAFAFLAMVIGDCGVNVFDSPDWPQQLSIAVAVPAVALFVAVEVFRYCLRDTSVSLRSLR